MTIAQRVAELFSGRFDCYAEGFPHPTKPNKFSYATRKEPLTLEVLEAHLAGSRRVGIYPLVDNYVRWFAIDFDAPKDEDGQVAADGFSVAWAEAEAQAARLEGAGLFVYLERSRSMHGVHLWGFFDDAIDAAVVLRALKPLMVEASSFDRIYPVQSQVESGGYGNLIALPFQGESWPQGGTAFLNRDTLEPIPLETFLDSVERNNRFVIEELAERAPKERPKSRELRTVDGDSVVAFEGRPREPISGFLKLISPYGCRFMHHAWVDRKKLSQPEWWVAVGQCTVFENGRDAAHLLSQDYPGYTPEETDALYDRLSQHPPHGCAYIHAHFPQHACSGCPRKAPYHLAQRSVVELAGTTVEPLEQQDWGDAVQRVRRRHQGKEDTGALWHTAGLDEYTRLRDGELIIVGARPSLGKTSIAVDLAYNQALHGTASFLFSAETNKAAMQDRFLARVSGVDSRLLRNEGVRVLTPDEWEELDRAREKLSALPLFVNYSATDPEQMLLLYERAVLRNRIPLAARHLIQVDYLQFASNLAAAAYEKEFDRISRASTTFKLLTKITRKPWVVYSQMTRGAEGEEAPTLADLSGSTQIERDADTVIVLAGQRIPGPVAPRDLWILKQKEGDAGVRVQTLLHQAVSHFEPRYTAAPPPRDLFADTSDAHG